MKTGKGVSISTVGVDIGDWTFEKKDRSASAPNQGSVVFRTWDFGGQTEYYATHQYFLSKRSLYIVVWKVSTYQNSHCKRWIKTLFHTMQYEQDWTRCSASKTTRRLKQLAWIYKDWQTDRLTDWRTDGLTDWQTDRLTDWRTDRLTDRCKYNGQTDGQKNRHTNTQTDRQNVQTEKSWNFYDDDNDNDKYKI